MRKVAAILFSLLLIVGLSPMTQLRLVVWLIIGLGIYFSYGKKHSKVQRGLYANRPAPGNVPVPGD